MRAPVRIGVAVLALALCGCRADDDDIPPDTGGGDGAGDDGASGEDGIALDEGVAEVEDGVDDDGPTEADATACAPSDHLSCMEACATPWGLATGGVCVDGECRCDLCDDPTCYAYCGMHMVGGRNTSECNGDYCQCSHEDPAWDADAGADVGAADEAADADAGAE